MLRDAVARKRIDWMIDPTIAKIDGTWMPTEKHLRKVWKTFSEKQKIIVAALISSETYGDIFEKDITVSLQECINNLKNDPDIVLAVVAGRMCNLPSDSARQMYLSNLVQTVHLREVHRKELTEIIKTDKQHLKEIATKIKIDGNGKRDLLKELIAYGMQTKLHEDAVVDEGTGAMVRPPIYTLADPRIAFTSIQELNKMDHEYSVDDSATSSTETQAERIRRLKKEAPIKNKQLINMIHEEAERQAKKLNGVAKKVASRKVNDSTPEDYNANS